MKMESVDFIPLGQRACMEIVKRFCYFSYPCKAMGKDGMVLKKRSWKYQIRMECLSELSEFSEVVAFIVQAIMAQPVIRFLQLSGCQKKKLIKASVK